MNLDEHLKRLEQLQNEVDSRFADIQREQEDRMTKLQQQLDFLNEAVPTTSPINVFSEETMSSAESCRRCHECGASVSEDAVFCEQCGCRLEEELDEDTINTFIDDEDDDDAEDDASASSSSVARIVRISFGGQRGHMVRQYDCGDENDELYEMAQKVIDGEMEASDFEMELDDCSRGYNDVFVQPIEGNDYRTYLTVTDVNTDEIIFDDEIEVGTSLSGDPRYFDYSALENEDEIREKIKEMEDEIEDCEEYDFDEESWEDRLEDLKEVICESMCFGNNVYYQRRKILEKGENHRVFVYAPEIYGFSYECEIELDAGEEFNVDNLTFFVDDYDGVIPGDFNICIDSVTPYIKYGDKFYECSVEDWEEHYCNYYIADENNQLIWSR